MMKRQAAERGHGHKHDLLARNQVLHAMGGRGGAPLPHPNPVSGLTTQIALQQTDRFPGEP